MFTTVYEFLRVLVVFFILYFIFILAVHIIQKMKSKPQPVEYAYEIEDPVILSQIQTMYEQQDNYNNQIVVYEEKLGIYKRKLSEIDIKISEQQTEYRVINESHYNTVIQQNIYDSKINPLLEKRNKINEDIVKTQDRILKTRFKSDEINIKVDKLVIKYATFIIK